MAIVNGKQSYENCIKRLVAQASEKDTLYYVLFENHKSVMLLIDPETGRILEANKAAATYYGYSKDQLTNMNIKEINILSPEQVQMEMQHARSENRNYFEFIHRLATGEEREVEVYSYPVKIEGKTLLFSVINDISDRLNNELMFNTLFFNSPYGVVILDKDERIVNVNRNFSTIFQYELSEIKGKHLSRLVASPDNMSQIESNVQLVYRGGVLKQEGVRRRKDGKLINVEILGYPVSNRQSIVSVYIIYNDISEKKDYEEQLLLFKKVLENNSEGVFITDIDGNIQWINAAFEKITGFSLAESKGKKINILKSGVHDRSFYIDMRDRLKAAGTWSGEIWNKTKDGEIYCEWLSINGIKDSDNKITHYVGIFRDLSERKKMSRKMAELQQRDILTGLYNRGYFMSVVSNLIKSQKPEDKFAVIYIDIVDFKEINNSLGHHIGDRLLVELSERLQLLKSDNCIISRYSGDEFAILYKDINIENNAMNKAWELMEKIKQPFEVENTVLGLSVSIGISIFPEDGLSAETLIRHAETAMYSQKGQVDSNISFYQKNMSKEIEEKFHLINLLSRAITNRELTICYQPIFSIKDPDTIVGVEALLRWKNPVFGEVLPDIFIPLAEKSGHILYIGDWVLEQVCRQIKAWKKTGYSILPVAINISVKQLEHADFSKRVIGLLEKHNIAPNSIELEITESVSLGDVTTIVRNLKELKGCGIKISMDDFGTGFSSLGQIDMFELDKLKIDKFFINDILNVAKKQNLVKTIIAMARSLDLTVVAEGIETNEQLLYLKEFGCQFGQGYLLSRPLPANEVVKLLMPEQNL